MITEVANPIEKTYYVTNIINMEFFLNSRLGGNHLHKNCRGRLPQLAQFDACILIFISFIMFKV